MPCCSPSSRTRASLSSEEDVPYTSTPRSFPDLHGSGANSSSDRMNEDARACWLVDKARFPERKVGGEEIDRKSSALLGCPSRGYRPKQRAIGSGLLGKGSPLRVSHHAAAAGIEAGKFSPRNQRRLGSARISAARGHQVGEVEASGFHLDQKLIGSGMRLGHCLHFADFRSPKTSDHESQIGRAH